MDHREVISLVGSLRNGRCARPLWPLVTTLSFYKQLALLPSSLFLIRLSVVSSRREGNLALLFEGEFLQLQNTHVHRQALIASGPNNKDREKSSLEPSLAGARHNSG